MSKFIEKVIRWIFLAVGSTRLHRIMVLLDVTVINLPYERNYAHNFQGHGKPTSIGKDWGAI